MRKKKTPAKRKSPVAERAGLYWVGIGASAGGLEAIRELAKNLPVDTNAIFLIAQHMAPQHKSLLSELIGRETNMHVEEVVDGTIPKPNRIYVAPPKADLIIQKGALRLREPSTEPATPKPSVDRFFRSLAEEVGERAIGIILSGTGSDGSYGIQAIRAEGGITIVQDEASAKYTGMPHAAMDTGCIDLELSPSEIGKKFVQIASHPRNLAPLKVVPEPEDDYSSLLQILWTATKVDFREYKSSTIQRRIQRRMAALGINEIGSYLSVVRSSDAEVQSLFKDLLISVTSFFRDTHEFESIREQIKILLAERRDHGLRIWVPGCATGEEAYSIAMLIANELGGLKALPDHNIQIFATDVDENAITRARRGQYSEAALDDVPEEWRTVFFQATAGIYAIAKPIRDMIVFSVHNLCKDPPFQNMDMVSCRNLLIYFRPSLQQRVLSYFHYSLLPHGVLFLGKSEAISGSEDLFRQLGEERHIFRRRISLNKQTRGKFVPIQQPDIRRIAPRPPEDSALKEARAMFDGLVDTVCPNSIIASPDLHVKHAYGNLGRFVTLSAGNVRTHISSLIETEYSQEVQTLAALALRTKQVKKGVIRTDDDNPAARTQVKIYPISVDSETFLLIAFDTWVEEDLKQVELESTELDENVREQVKLLERELHTTRESLQQTVEELETSNEELQAVNEELQSANQELQSTNEELQTSNEELQSTNQELTTVNEELDINSQQLTALNYELKSVLENAGVSILVVNEELNVTRASQMASDLFDIDPEFRIPHVSQCRLPDGFPSIASVLSDAITSRKLINQEITGKQWQGILTVAPYLNDRNIMAGAVAVFAETTELSRTRDELNLIFENVPVGIVVTDSAGTCVRANGPFRQMVEMNSDVPVIGRKASELLPAPARKRFLAIVSRALKEQKRQTGQVFELKSKGGRKRKVLFDSVPLTDESTGEPVVYTVGLDVTAQFKAEELAAARTRQLSLAAQIAQMGYYRFYLSGRKLVWYDEMYKLFEETPETFKPSIKGLLQLIHPDDREEVSGKFEEVIASGQPELTVYRFKLRTGQVKHIRIVGDVEKDRSGRVTGWFGIAIDVTNDLQRSAELGNALDELSRSNAELSRFAYVCSHDLKEPVRTIAAMSKILNDPDADLKNLERAEIQERISANAERLGEIIEGLLAYSQINSVTKTENVDLNDVVAYVRNDLEHAIAAHDGKIEIDHLPVIPGAEVHFRQLFQNLIGNALKYGQQAGCQIDIRSKALDTDWEISIEDNGPGVDKEDRERIFSVFERLHRSDEVEGSGLGLAICRRIVDHYGGSIRCEASDLGGAAFRVNIPKR